MTTTEAYQIVDAWGKIIEQYPNCIPNSAIPLAIDDIKFAIKILLKEISSKEERDILEVGYLLLADIRSDDDWFVFNQATKIIEQGDAKEALNNIEALEQHSRMLNENSIIRNELLNELRVLNKNN